MTHDPRDPTWTGQDTGPVDPANPTSVGDGGAGGLADDDTRNRAGALFGDGDTAPLAARGSVDPINRWATEHYGFEDDAAGPVPPVSVVPAPARTSGTHVPRKRALVVGGVLGMVLTGGVGGAAIAAVADDADRDGRGGGNRVEVDDLGRDGNRSGGSR